mmetsp:Transcript_36798/g.92990  ORF Transcript_36798/g.92990 Transcript_36798/m.92990 type:complete len:235 (-) Transcript_36798:1893-2597(-)
MRRVFCRRNRDHASDRERWPCKSWRSFGPAEAGERRGRGALAFASAPRQHSIGGHHAASSAGSVRLLCEHCFPRRRAEHGRNVAATRAAVAASMGRGASLAAVPAQHGNPAVRTQPAAMFDREAVHDHQPAASPHAAPGVRGSVARPAAAWPKPVGPRAANSPGQLGRHGCKRRAGCRCRMPPPHPRGCSQATPRPVPATHRGVGASGMGCSARGGHSASGPNKAEQHGGPAAP